MRPWYHNKIPEIAHFFFIKSTKDICFVERNGQTRIYNLDSSRFQPEEVQLPIDTKHVLSTPEGTCIVAFTQDKPLNSNVSESFAPTSTDPAVTDFTSNPAQILANCTTSPPLNLTDIMMGSNLTRAHIYFCEKFTGHAVKIIDLSFTDSSVNLLNFSLLDNRQIHLVAIDPLNRKFRSVLVKIRSARTKNEYIRDSKEVSFKKALEDGYIKKFEYGTFENIREIASGAFGTVYYAYCTAFKRNVALKCLHRDDKSLFYDNFVKEVITLPLFIIY